MNRQRAPLGRRTLFAARPHRLAFEVARYDVGKPLVIDPSVMVGTYLGGLRIRSGLRDCNKSYRCLHNRFPPTPELPQQQRLSRQLFRRRNGCVYHQAESVGNGIVYSTYLGGTNTDSGQAIAVDAQGSAYVTAARARQIIPLSLTVQSLYGGNSDRLYYGRLIRPVIT